VFRFFIENTHLLFLESMCFITQTFLHSVFFDCALPHEYSSGILVAVTAMRILFLNFILSFLKICDKKDQLSYNRLAYSCVCCTRATFLFYFLVFEVINNLAGKMKCCGENFATNTPYRTVFLNLRGLGILLPLKL
jgi:hypothetical protein